LEVHVGDMVEGRQRFLFVEVEWCAIVMYSRKWG
jgi:hypothetical protein